MFIKNEIKYNHIICSLRNVLIIYLLDLDIYVITVYRPPSYNNDDNIALTNFLVEFCSNKEVLIQGDFNLPSLSWQDTDPLLGYVSPLDMVFFNSFVDIGLTQLVHEPTNFPSGNTLDLCLVTHAERICSCVTLPPLPSCSHVPVLIAYTFQNMIFSQNILQPEVKRLWSRGNYDLMAQCLGLVDWDGEFFTLTVQQQYDKFLLILEN